MKVKVWVYTDKVGSRTERVFDIDDDAWEEMSETERSEMLMEMMLNKWMVEWGYCEV